MRRLGVRTVAAGIAVAGVASGAAALAGAPPRAVALAFCAGLAAALLAGVWLSRTLGRAVSALARDLESETRASRAAAPTASLAELEPLVAAHERRRQQWLERLRAHEQAQARLSAVIAAMDEGVLAVDREGRVLLANRRLRELIGAPGEAEGRPLIEVVRDAELLTALEKALRDAEPRSLEVEPPGSPRRTLRVALRPLREGAHAAGVLAVFRDVTELRRLDAVRRDFVANASHELKTPVAVIRGFAERLAGKPLGDPALERALETIQRNAERLGALIEDLLELSRIESRAPGLEPRALDLEPWLRRWLAELAPRLEAAKLEASLEVEAPLEAWVDPDALEHVLGNLMDNAIQYSEAGGSIRVTAHAEDGWACISVADRGCGIPAKDLPRIFERFYRVDPARSRALGGTGLGLSIVKHLVDAMGGQVSVESQPGRGSTFRVRLPTRKVAPAPPRS